MPPVVAVKRPYHSLTAGVMFGPMEADMQKTACAMLVLALGAPGARADVWDASVPDDNSIVSTPNMLVHGDTQVHDLAANPGPLADDDWYVVYSAPYSSYEFLQTGSTGEIVVPSRVLVERHDPGGALLQSGNHLGNLLSWADAISLPWENTAGLTQYDFIRVTSLGCGTSCTANSQYTARFYETTYAVPRFNNFGGQVTVLPSRT